MRKRNKIVSTWFFTFRVPFGAAYVCPLPFPPCFSSPAPACHATHTAANSAGVYDTAQHGTVRNLIKCEFFFFFFFFFFPARLPFFPFLISCDVRRAMQCDSVCRWLHLCGTAFRRDWEFTRTGIWWLLLSIPVPFSKTTVGCYSLTFQGASIFCCKRMKKTKHDSWVWRLKCIWRTAVQRFQRFILDWWVPSSYLLFSIHNSQSH